MNPNNCETCRHKQNPDGGHCYMFRDAPNERCMQHTGLKVALIVCDRKSMIRAALHELAKNSAY